MGPGGVPGRCLLAVLAEYCLPFLKVEGYFVAIERAKLEEELKKAGNALLLLGGRVDKIMGLKLPFTGEERKLVLIRKTGPTPGNTRGVPAYRKKGRCKIGVRDDLGKNSL